MLQEETKLTTLTKLRSDTKKLNPNWKHGIRLFNMTIDTQPILLVIDSYLNLKTHSITCIYFLNIIVWQKLDQACESGKMSKALWMGFALGIWSMCAWHWNIPPQTLHVSMGSMFQVSGCWGIETCARPPIETWHVSKGIMFWISGLWYHVLGCDASERLKQALGHCWNMRCFGFNLLEDSCCLCVKTQAGLPRNEWHIYDLSLK
jgi:hypothetical protein